MGCTIRTFNKLRQQNKHSLQFAITLFTIRYWPVPASQDRPNLAIHDLSRST